MLQGPMMNALIWNLRFSMRVLHYRFNLQTRSERYPVSLELDDKVSLYHSIFCLVPYEISVDLTTGQWESVVVVRRAPHLIYCPVPRLLRTQVSFYA
jgi:hypothetical protein